MSIIRILPASVANRIAAGEVIERPASVVKELVENAIDAGATRISIGIQDGGKRLIQVTDDGCGMDRDDALLCLEAHATSKIRETADVGAIRTLGFRGEALPSISSVCRFQLQTRPGDAPIGTEVVVESGKLVDVQDCGCAPGTHVRVAHLFANMPARRKFLKGANTEEGHIQETVLLQALAHPGTAFDLRAGNREILNVSPTTDLGTRVGMLLGRDALAAMLPVEYEESGIHITGLVGKPGFTRPSRREQRIFVNGRPASAEVVYHALREAYHTLVMKGRYPPIVLYIELDAERVDVNVHPAKREVRFRESQLVSQIVAAAVRSALRGLVDLRNDDVGSGLPDFPGALQSLQIDRIPVQEDFPAISGNVPQPLDAPEPKRTVSASPPTMPPAESPPHQAPESLPPPPAPSPAPPPPRPKGIVRSDSENIQAMRIIGELQGRFLLAEGQGGLVVIDPQAAHRRILFEKMLAAASRDSAPQQQLLIPVTVDLGADDARLLKGNVEHFQKLGFAVEPFGGNTFLVVGVPPDFPDDGLATMLREILDDLRHGSGTTASPKLIRIAQAACTHAVRRRDTLSREEQESLLRDLAATEMPYTCPNGQPVMASIPISDLEKRLGIR